MPVSFRRYIFVSPVGRGVFGSVGPWRPPTLVGVHGLALARGGGKLAVWPDSAAGCWGAAVTSAGEREITTGQWRQDRKSTRLNSSHVKISYAVFCLKKKKRGRLLLRRCT